MGEHVDDAVDREGIARVDAPDAPLRDRRADCEAMCEAAQIVFRGVLRRAGDFHAAVDPRGGHADVSRAGHGLLQGTVSAAVTLPPTQVGPAPTCGLFSAKPGQARVSWRGGSTAVATRRRSGWGAYACSVPASAPHP